MARGLAIQPEPPGKGDPRMAVSDQPGTSARPDLAARIDSEKSRPLPWRTVAKRAVVVLIAGVAIYLVFPAITEVFASWPRLSTLDPWWLTAALAAAGARFPCPFTLQRPAVRPTARLPANA